MFILRVCTKCHIYITYITRNNICTIHKYRTLLSTKVDLVNQLTDVLYRFQYIFGELPYYITSWMVTCHYDARTVSLSHSNTHFSRVFPNNLCKVAYKQKIEKCCKYSHTHFTYNFVIN